MKINNISYKECDIMIKKEWTKKEIKEIVIKVIREETPKLINDLKGLIGIK